MKILDEYKSLQEEIFKYFGYVEDWRVIPINDTRECYWKIVGTEQSSCVRFADDIETLEDDHGNYYENTIYTQRFLPKWVYRGEEYTMICVDTRTDGNKFLQIFSNDKEQHFNDTEKEK